MTPRKSKIGCPLEHCLDVWRFTRTYALTLALCACVQPWDRFKAGEPESAVTAALGQPKETYDLPNGGKRHLMWPTQPMGETTVAADIDLRGRQSRRRPPVCCSTLEFYRAEPGKWTREDVLVNFRSSRRETMYLPLVQAQEVWSYRYLEDNTWYQLFHFYFDDAGVLRSTQKSPDPLHDHADDHPSN